MTSDTNNGDTPDFSGRMFLYESPELLSRQRHQGMGLVSATRDFEFAREATGVPLAMTELVSASKNFPVVFVGGKNPGLSVTLGFPHRENLFVCKDGRWERDAYVPAYLDCHPFALARSEKNEVALVLDRASALIGEDPVIPFFDGDDLSPEMRSRAKFCAQFDADQAMTQAFCRRVEELGLLSTQAAFYGREGSDGGEQELAEYLAVDAGKLAALDKDLVHELHANGYLSYIYAHLFSLENWARMADRLYR
ncbi:MAG: SapC family protein [Proteobacteria bacterium]|nr:SapC family protein [Pseudomonadota bacterium]